MESDVLKYMLSFVSTFLVVKRVHTVKIRQKSTLDPILLISLQHSIHPTYCGIGPKPELYMLEVTL